MTEMTSPTPGSLVPLDQVLQETIDLRTLDLAGFRNWLGLQLARWQEDPVFVQRARIRDLRGANPRLHELEQQQRRAAEEDAASPPFDRLCRIEEELASVTKAVTGLTGALSAATPDKRPALQQKLHDFQLREQTLRTKYAMLTDSSPQRQSLLCINADLHQLRSTLGLDREEAHLATLLARQGRRSSGAGESFEQRALHMTEQHILPRLGSSDNPGSAYSGLRVLTGVTLGAARIELDQLVIRQPQESGKLVEVLALVEVKRNINDLAHGFRQRQEDLAWLSGDTAGYDPGRCRTRSFPTGHFDREATHDQGGETFVFARSSFGRFRREPSIGVILGGLYFITRAGPAWGLSTAALSRVAHRVATEPRWEPSNESYLRELMTWCLSLAEPSETPDVLRLHASNPEWERQILILPRSPHP